jgi:hypothetical protein
MKTYSVTEAKNQLPKLIDRRLPLRDWADFDMWRAATTSSADIHAADARLANTYVRRFEFMLRAPDALHLAIAHRQRATLVTWDRRLKRAARELGIAIEVPRASRMNPLSRP